MSKNVYDYVASCNVCQRVKVPRHHSYEKLQVLPQPEGLWQEVTMNFITELPLSKQKRCIYDAILVVVNCYTKMVRYIYTIKTITAVKLAELFFNEIVCRYEVLKGIVSDRGSVFTSTFWLEICYHLKVKCRLSTAFHLQTDGQTECQN